MMTPLGSLMWRWDTKDNCLWNMRITQQKHIPRRRTLAGIVANDGLFA